MTEGEENIIIKGVLLEAISRDFSEELSNNKSKLRLSIIFLIC